MQGKAAIARILQREGVERFICFPDNGVIDEMAALGIRPILICTERVAINIAGSSIAALTINALQPIGERPKKHPPHLRRVFACEPATSSGRPTGRARGLCRSSPWLIIGA